MEFYDSAILKVYSIETGPDNWQEMLNQLI